MASENKKGRKLENLKGKLEAAKKAAEDAANAKPGGTSAEAAQANILEEGAGAEAQERKPEPGSKKAKPASRKKRASKKDPATTVAMPRSLLSQIRWRSLDLTDDRGATVMLWQVVAEALETPLEKKARRKKGSPGKAKAIDPDDPGPMTTLTLPLSVQREIRKRALVLAEEQGVSRVLQWTVIAKALGSLK